MEDLAIENEKLKKQIDVLLFEKKRLEIKYTNYFEYTNTIIESLIKDKNKLKDELDFSKCKSSSNLRIENQELIRKLEEKNEKCIKEKQALKNEIEELQKLVLKENYLNKRKRTEIITNC
jgi:hypothetical protein